MQIEVCGSKKDAIAPFIVECHGDEPPAGKRMADGDTQGLYKTLSFARLVVTPAAA